MLLPRGEPLWRRIARSARFAAGQEVLEVGSSSGEALCFWAATYGVQGTGVDQDPDRVSDAEERARGLELNDRAQFQAAAPDDLPFRDSIFDVTIGGISLQPAPAVAGALAELVRVTRPGGKILLVQWAWAPRAAAADRELLSKILDVHPRAPAEWQEELGNAGVSHPVIEHIDQVEVPPPDATLRTHFDVLRREHAFHGWRSVLDALRRERQAGRLLVNGNALHLSIIKGTK